MRLLLLLALIASIGGCITIHTAPVTAIVEERAPGSADDAGPSLSSGAVVDEISVDASAEHGATGGAVLHDGVDYLVTVEGTFSVWSGRQWRSVCAGTPDIGPVYRSVARTGPVGLDAAYAFAVPTGSSMCEREAPMTNPGWLYRLHPDDPWTTGPTAVSYAPDHVYQFPFTGKGAPLRVVVRDVAGQYRDNYGELRFTVRRATPSRPTQGASAP